MALKDRKHFVVLLKGDSSGNENKYTKLLEEEGIKAKSISTLEFNFINKGKLQNYLSNDDSYSGIILTSTRAVEAVSLALNSSVNLGLEKWKKKHNFSVGKATADLARSLLSLETQGADAGNSEKLCQFIIEKCGHISKPLIFPCSNIRKDTIPATLSQNGIAVEEVMCYETVPNVQFENIWTDLISNEGFPEVLVLFSPSGVKSCLDIVKKTYTVLPKFIAIGPSTEKMLLASDISCKTAEKPTPDSVVCVVKHVLGI